MPPDFGMLGNPALERNRGQHTFSYQVHRSTSPNGYTISFSSSQNGIQAPPQTYSYSAPRNNSPAQFQSYRPASSPTHVSLANDFPKRIAVDVIHKLFHLLSQCSDAISKDLCLRSTCPLESDPSWINRLSIRCAW